MSGSREQLARRVSSRWPTIAWPVSAFLAHLADDPSAPPHLEDLYLAGAAGHRVDAAWTVIETDFGPDTRRVLQRQPRADATAEDLWGDTIARLIDDDADRPPLDDGRQPAKITRYRGRIKLLNYLVLVARRIAIQRQRKHKPQLTLSGSQNTDLSGNDPDAPPANSLPNPGAEDPAKAAANHESASRLRETLARALDELTDEQRFLLSSIYRHGIAQKQAGAMLGWSPFKANRQVKAAINTLRDSLADLDDLDWTPQLRAAWEGCWAEAWPNETPPGPQSEPREASETGGGIPETGERA